MADKVTEEAAEIREFVDVVENEARVEGAVTNGVGVRSRMWAALYGGILHICS
jgi:hypothetical protein